MIIHLVPVHRNHKELVLVHRNYYQVMNLLLMLVIDDEMRMMNQHYHRHLKMDLQQLDKIHGYHLVNMEVNLDEERVH